MPEFPKDLKENQESRQKTKCVLDGNLAVISKSHFQSLSSPPWPDEVQTAAVAMSGHQRKSNMILTAASGSSETVGPQHRQGCTPRCCRGPPTDEWRDERTMEMETAGGLEGEKHDGGGGRDNKNKHRHQESWRQRVGAT